MLYYYHFKCILTLITLTLILNLALTFSLTLSRIVHSSFTSLQIYYGDLTAPKETGYH